MSDSEDHIETPSEGGDDLFGDGDDAPPSDHDQPLSDQGLDSEREMEPQEYDDDEEGEGRETQRETKTQMIQGVQMFRHRVPKPADGTLKALRVPPFITFNPIEYDADTYEPTQYDLENSKGKHPKPAVRFRKNPETGKLESNTVIYKWSDGSTTIGVGEEQYEIQTKSLAPPANKPYQELQDAHYYAAAAHLSSNSLVVVGHVTEQYTVRPNKKFEDDALQVLTARLEAATRSSHAEGDMMIRTTQDPELMKKQAEMAEKERERARRRRENAAARLDGTQPRYQRGALSINDLEGTGRRRPGGKRGAPGASRQKRRRPEYDSDDDLPQGQGRQEDYDHEDDFIAPSDEEISEAEEDDEDELEDDYDDEERPRVKKRQKPSQTQDEDADADADMDDDAPMRATDARRGHGRRRVIEEEDEE